MYRRFQLQVESYEQAYSATEYATDIQIYKELLTGLFSYICCVRRALDAFKYLQEAVNRCISYIHALCPSDTDKELLAGVCLYSQAASDRCMHTASSIQFCTDAFSCRQEAMDCCIQSQVGSHAQVHAATRRKLDGYWQYLRTYISEIPISSLPVQRHSISLTNLFPRLKVSLSISSYLLLFLSKPAVWPASAGHFIRALCCISSFLPSIISFSWYTYRMAYPNFRFQILLIPQRTDDRHIINLWRERLEESGDASLFSSTFNFVLLFFTKYSMYMQGSQFCSVNCRESYC